MRFVIGFVALVVLAACDSSTGPDDSAFGVYHLYSINGDSLYNAKQNPDGSQDFISGGATVKADGTYSYVFAKQKCFFNGCTALEVTEFAGKWTAQGNDFRFKDGLDGSVTNWHYSNHVLSLRETHFFNGGADLVFRVCSSQTFGCP